MKNRKPESQKKLKYLTRRQMMSQVAAGAAVFGLSQILNPNLALATTTNAASDMIAGQTPKMGATLVYGQTYPNWALRPSNRGEHAYYHLDLLTRSMWNALT